MNMDAIVRAYEKGPQIVKNLVTTQLLQTKKHAKYMFSIRKHEKE